jgi:hypothetical protein
MGIHAQFALVNRRVIANEIERLIALLDIADGDFDLEEDDPAGDALDERGECLTDDGTEMLSTLPLYGLDQSAGPVNEREAAFVRRRQLMQRAASI